MSKYFEGRLEEYEDQVFAEVTGIAFGMVKPDSYDYRTVVLACRECNWNVEERVSEYVLREFVDPQAIMGRIHHSLIREGQKRTACPHLAEYFYLKEQRRWGVMACAGRYGEVQMGLLLIDRSDMKMVVVERAMPVIKVHSIPTPQASFANTDICSKFETRIFELYDRTCGVHNREPYGATYREVWP